MPPRTWARDRRPSYQRTVWLSSIDVDVWQHHLRAVASGCRTWYAGARCQRFAWRERVAEGALKVLNFETCPRALVQLGRRWSLLQSESRNMQLAWEASRVAAREPRLLVAHRALCAALLALGKFRHAREAASEASTRFPLEPFWKECCREADAQKQNQLLGCTASLRKWTPITVASVFCGEEFLENMRPARENHERWCATHGYRYVSVEQNVAGRADPTWSKIPTTLRLFQEGVEMVFWIDADSLFVHLGVDLQWACDLDRDFVFAGDVNVVFNAGHFLARRSEWTTRFLADAFSIYPWPEWEDNGAMMILLGGGVACDPSTWRPAFERMKVPTRTREECAYAMRELLPPSIVEHVTVVPQHLLNAYEWPGGGGITALARGDPILHFAGCTAEEKARLTSVYAGASGDPAVMLGLHQDNVSPHPFDLGRACQGTDVRAPSSSSPLLFNPADKSVAVSVHT